jgi:anti-sigma factor RsiW
MRCYRARRWLVSYLDGELEPRRREALEHHLSGCPACCAELARFEAHWETMADVDPAPPVPVGLWGEILTSLDEAERTPWFARHRARLLQAACVTACVFLGFSGGALLSWKHSPIAGAPDENAVTERLLVADAFDVTAFGMAEGKEGLLQCVPR